jgi:spore coat polysaccharide biosynthesis protein SpsF (cytidylyltransferase family)
MTQDEIKEMAYNAGFSIANGIVTGGITDLKRFAELVAAKKHEELYRLAEDAPVRGDARETRQNILHAIRGGV